MLLPKYVVVKGTKAKYRSAKNRAWLPITTSKDNTFLQKEVKYAGHRVYIFLRDGNELHVPAKSVDVHEPCCETGRYIGMVNGRPADLGLHFACEGKCYQDNADRKRNAAYWSHRAASEIRGDMARAG